MTEEEEGNIASEGPGEKTISLKIVFNLGGGALKENCSPQGKKTNYQKNKKIVRTLLERGGDQRKGIDNILCLRFLKANSRETWEGG